MDESLRHQYDGDESKARFERATGVAMVCRGAPRV